MDTRKFAALSEKVSGLRCTCTEHHCIKLFEQFVGWIINTNLSTFHKYDTFQPHQINSTFDNQLFVEFHVWNAKHHETPDTVISLEHRDTVTGLVKLVSTGKP